MTQLDSTKLSAPTEWSGADGSEASNDESIQAVNRAIDEQRALVVYAHTKAQRDNFSKAVARALARPCITVQVDTRTTLADLLCSVGTGGQPQPGPLWWGLNWASARAQLDAAGSNTTGPVHAPVHGPVHAPPSDPRNGTVIAVEEVDKASPDLSEALLACLELDALRIEGLEQSIPLAESRPLLVLLAGADCVLSDVFSSCVTLHLPDETKHGRRDEAAANAPVKLLEPPPDQLAVITPPRLGGVPFLGVLPQMLRKQVEALDDWYEKGGDIFEVKLAGLKLLIVARGDLAAEGVINNRTDYVRSPAFSAGLRSVAGDSVLTLDGTPWRERRRALQPKFHARVMLGMVPRIHAAFDAVLDQIEPGRVEVSSMCDHMTMSVGLRILFGHALDPETFEELSRLSQIVISRVVLGWITSKLPTWLKLPGESKFREARARLDEILLDMARARRESGDFGDDLLGTLLHMASQGELDDRGVRDEAVTMLLAGYETTANSLGWTLHTLAGHPEVAAKIRAEANAVYDGDGDVRKLEYSLWSFKEGLRLHPSALWFPRLAVNDTKIGDYTIRAGETIVCSTHLIHRNPRDWPNPTKYEPDRWAGETPRYAFMPFGIGQQMCIGKHLALLEGQIALARICRRWELSPVESHRARKRISTTLNNVDGIYVDFRPVEPG